MLLKTLVPELVITAFPVEIGGVGIEKYDLAEMAENALRVPDSRSAAKMLERMEACRRELDSCGGVVECRVSGVPAGWGEPVFDKLDALLAHAVLSIGAVKGFAAGAGFDAARLTGSANNASPDAAGGSGAAFRTGRRSAFRRR